MISYLIAYYFLRQLSRILQIVSVYLYTDITSIYLFTTSYFFTLSRILQYSYPVFYKYLFQLNYKLILYL